MMERGLKRLYCCGAGALGVISPRAITGRGVGLVVGEAVGEGVVVGVISGVGVAVGA